MQNKFNYVYWYIAEITKFFVNNSSQYFTKVFIHTVSQYRTEALPDYTPASLT